RTNLTTAMHCTSSLTCLLPSRTSIRPPRCFFFTDTPTPEIYTLSLHDALPIWAQRRAQAPTPGRGPRHVRSQADAGNRPHSLGRARRADRPADPRARPQAGRVDRARGTRGEAVRRPRRGGRRRTRVNTDDGRRITDHNGS